MSTPTLHPDRRQTDTPTPRGVRLRLNPTRQYGEIVDGAWWPRSRELTSELPALLGALPPEFGPVQRVIYDENDWATTPPSVRFRDEQVILDYFGAPSTHTVSMISDRLQSLTLLVVPPFTNPTRAYTTVMAAADPDDVATVDELLGIDPGEAAGYRLALVAHQRWESEGGALDCPETRGEVVRQGAGPR